MMCNFKGFLGASEKKRFDGLGFRDVYYVLPRADIPLEADLNGLESQLIIVGTAD